MDEPRDEFVPGWTLLISIGAPVLAASIAASCKELGLPWKFGLPIALALFVGESYFERWVDRRYVPSRYRRARDMA